MRIENLNTGNIATKALYFPKDPNSIANNKNIKNAVYNNKYIQSIAENEDVLVRFMPKGKYMQHLLILDIVDLNTAQTKKSMWFSSRLFGKFANIRPENFIEKITEPVQTTKNSFWNKLFHRNKNSSQTANFNQTEFFNYQEFSPLKDDSVLLSKGLKKENELLKEAENARQLLNTNIIKNIKK